MLLFIYNAFVNEYRQLAADPGLTSDPALSSTLLENTWQEVSSQVPMYVELRLESKDRQSKPIRGSQGHPGPVWPSHCSLSRLSVSLCAVCSYHSSALFMSVDCVRWLVCRRLAFIINRLQPVRRGGGVCMGVRRSAGFLAHRGDVVGDPPR